MAEEYHQLRANKMNQKQETLNQLVKEAKTKTNPKGIRSLEESIKIAEACGVYEEGDK